MKIFLVSVLACLSFLPALAQDTTWVQTFTFDSITSRRANFQFPASLENQRFEKVLMYYKLKCSPLTTWDSYDCGEWDYLTYTHVFDHTGVMDSVRRDGFRYRVNTLSPASVSYNSAPVFDQQWRSVQTRDAVAATPYAITGTGIASPLTLVASGSNGHTMQWMISAAELTTAGIAAGDIQALELSLLNAVSDLQNVTIRIKATSMATLSAWETTGFTTVFNNDLSAVPAGTATFNFAAPFAWDGTSNIVVELSYADANTAMAGVQLTSEESAAANTGNYDGQNGVFRTTASNYAEINMSNVDLGGDLSVSFWAKGNGSFGTNTSVLEAVDSLNNRILNIHFPWSDNSIYFDAGSGDGNYDRISKVTTAADIDNSWHQWVYVKKTSTGQMFIYKDGVLWHSGTGMTRPVGRVDRFFLGSNNDQQYQYKGDLDEFSVWTTALDAATIAAWKDKKIDPTHPDYASLEVYYDFDNIAAIVDKSGNNRLGMCSADGMIQWSQYAIAGRTAGSVRPVTTLMQGTYGPAEADSVLTARFPQPKVLFEYTPFDNSFHVIGNEVIYTDATTDTLSVAGTVIATENNTLATTVANEQLTYYEAPYELVNDVEIGRYITPYGINFSLGPGFTWLYDVTDYQQYLKGMVDFAAHNTQELIDVKFAFIEGTPPRDVHSVQPIWSNYRSYNYAEMASDAVLTAVPVALSDTSEMFKIKTRLSGHGQVGDAACCEWAPKDHQLIIDGVPRFTWNIWRETQCGTNPNTKQGGTWPYAREGWCPGDMVQEYDHEITPYVTPGDTVLVDYDINDVPSNDPGQAGGNYIVAMDLVSYSAPNFQHDAAIIDILNPNNWEYYRKWNPTCSNPRVVIQNTGEQPLTSCRIRCWVTYGTWLEYTWTGNLGFLEKEVVEIPLTDQNFWFGTDTVKEFVAQIYDLNGTPNIDEYAPNNVFRTHYAAPEMINGPFFVWFTTNNRAVENNWRLINGNTGETIFERTTLANATQYQDTFNLDPGCYSIILEDSDHDGIGFWYSAQVEGETTGQFRLRQVGGGYIEMFPADFGMYHQYNFSVGYALGTTDNGMIDEDLQLFPNPATEKVRIEFNGNLGKKLAVVIMDANGRILKNIPAESQGNYFGVDIPIADLNNGLYFVKVTGSEGVRTSQFVKQ